MKSPFSFSILIPVAAALLASACATRHAREFLVETINSSEENVPCVIYLDDALLVDPEQMPILTPAPVHLVFEDAGEARKPRLRVRAVKLGADGKVVGGLGENDKGDASPYHEELRYVRHDDARKQLFILRRNKSYDD
jgi:ketosteroid isomerase-like protein